MTTVLLPDDIRRVLQYMPKDVIELLKHGSSPGMPLFLAGGSIRAVIADEPITDWDLFGPSETELELVARRMAAARNGHVHKTRNAYTVLAPPRIPVQFITRWLYDSAINLVRTFDFTIARAAIWWKDDGGWHSCCDAWFYQDLAARRLRYMSPIRNADAGGSALRMLKFLKRGYTISPESLASVIARMTVKMRTDEGAPDKWDDELWHAKVLTGLLREVDPLTVIDGLEPRDTSSPSEETEGA